MYQNNFFFSGATSVFINLFQKEFDLYAVYFIPFNTEQVCVCNVKHIGIDSLINKKKGFQKFDRKLLNKTTVKQKFDLIFMIFTITNIFVSLLIRYSFDFISYIY